MRDFSVSTFYVYGNIWKNSVNNFILKELIVSRAGGAGLKGESSLRLDPLCRVVRYLSDDQPPVVVVGRPPVPACSPARPPGVFSVRGATVQSVSVGRAAR